jgi:hypothetical protein
LSNIKHLITYDLVDKIISGGDQMSKIHVKNQLNNGLTIEFCFGDQEFTLKHDEEVTIQIKDEDCMYFDIVRK